MQQLSLNGAWKLRRSEGQRGRRPEYAERVETAEARYIDAAVPGEVHLDPGIREVGQPLCMCRAAAANSTRTQFWNVTAVIFDLDVILGYQRFITGIRYGASVWRANFLYKPLE